MGARKIKASQVPPHMRMVESCGCWIRSLDTRHAVIFELRLIGVPMSRLTLTPGSGDAPMAGGNIVAAGLRACGVDPHSVMFTVWDVHP